MIEKAKKEVVDMSRYIKSETIHEKCTGCEKVFNYIAIKKIANESGELADVELITPKCKVYIRPAVWWEEMPVATRKELVKDRDHPQGILVDVPVIDRVCPVATHVEIKKTAKGNKLNPIKASKRANKK